MKKVSCIVCFILCVLLVIPVNAAEENKPLTDLLTESQNAAGLVPELDPGRLPEGVTSIEGQPILVVLQLSYSCDFTQYSLEELYDICNFTEYTVINQTMTVLSDRYSQPNEKYQAITVSNHYNVEGIPTFIEDILDGSSKRTFFGAECIIQNVICLRGFASIFVYYITDGGTFVCVYESFDADKPCQAIFTLQDFVTIFDMYLNFCNSDRYSNPNNPDSTPGMMGHFFTSYIHNPGSYHKLYCNIDTNGLDEHVAFYTVSFVCLVSVVAIGAVVYWYIRDKKKRTLEASIAWIQDQSQMNESV